MDEWTRWTIRETLLSLPKHFRRKDSYLRLINEPLLSIKWLLSPLIYVIAKPKQRGRTELYAAALDRLVELSQSELQTTLVSAWPADKDLQVLRDEHSIAILEELFRKHGSNKVSVGYAPIYQIILAHITSTEHQAPIAEIGIGSQNPAIPSNMTVFGKPGASLRAFRDYCPQTEVIGGDIDIEALINEERITSLHVDQLQHESVLNFFSRFSQYSLLIDDGLHEIDANLNTLAVALRFATPGSWIVIEDIAIDESIINIWLCVAKLISNTHRVWLVRCPQTFVFIANCRVGHTPSAT